VPYDQTRKLVDKEHRKAAKARAKDIADEGIAGKAVSDAVQAEVTSTVLTAAVGAGVAASASSGG